ncbi:type I polyketide synthase [Micromonospora sp. CA-111912]|uniref:type I polyketide synthase n=1 Tax=Micromonospora sp. CA-111912 TaxID=3239955 RepID=UPI003D8D8ADA
MRAELIRALPLELREHADSFGEKVAFQDDKRAVTYGDLEARTRRLAGHLMGLGVRRGDRVMICLRNSVETLESYLAILRAGAVGVPVNPASTDPELDYFLADSAAAVVITDPVHVAGFLRSPSLAPDARLLVTGDAPTHPSVHTYQKLAASEPAVTAPDDLGLDETAWIFYTSGTTERPKGVLSSQRNCLYSVAASYVPIPGLSADDRVLWPLPLFHSLSHIACVLAVTVVGATARIMDSPSGDEFLEAARETRATFVAGVPATYHYLLEARRQRWVALPDLRIGLVGGAVAGPELCRSFREEFGVPLVDAYGSTETCGAITMNPPGGVRVDGSCGLPVPGVDVRIVDPETGRDMPVGAEGEVWVRGPNVTSGYHNKPEATAAAFRDGWYRTGDLARRDTAGYFTICGRISDLIIRGGENVHPEEIEAVLRAAPGIADVGVAGRPHEVLGEVPVAYVVTDPSGVDMGAVIERCRRELSTFKVPEEVYEVVSVPRTASGKIQRRRLADQPAVLRYTASGSHDGVLRLEWVPAPSHGTASPAPTTWAFVGSAAAGLAAAVGSSSCYADLATADAAEMTVLLAPEMPGTWAERCAETRQLVEAVTAWAARVGSGQLVLLTRHSVTVSAEDEPADPAQAMLAAATGRVLGSRAILVDLDDESPIDAVPYAILRDEPRWVLRSGALLVARLTRQAVPDRSMRDSWSGADGVVVLTGADTVRGAAVARHLASVHPNERLVLIASGDAAAAAWESTIAPGPAAAVILADGDSELARKLSNAADSDRTSFIAIVDPYEVTKTADPGRAVSAAMVDAVVHDRRRRGLAGAVLTWCEPAGDTPGSPWVRDGLFAVDTLLATSDPAPLFALRPRRPEPGAGMPALLRAIFPEPLVHDGLDDTTSALRAELSRLDRHAQHALLQALVRDETAATLNRPGTAGVPADRTFRDLGCTSAAIVELRTRLMARTGLKLPTGAAFDHPTPRALAAFLHTELVDGTATDTATDTAVGTPSGTDEPIAIIGMACRLPGGITGSDGVWDLVSEGREASGPFPTDRGWDLERLFDADPGRARTSYVDRGGFLDDAAEFDADFFGISPREAIAMDPQQRVLLETSWEALEHAGIDASSLRGADAGVFAGLMEQGYGTSGPVPEELEAFQTTGTAGSVASGRISYLLGLRGPAITVDTACSSSLVALHLAAHALRRGECSLALAGGATVMATPQSFVEFSRQRALAADGRCKSYASAADGTAWAEGAGVLVLERLGDARRNGRRILAVLRGSSVNSDGASNGLTAPSGEAQQRVIRQALTSAGLGPADVDAVEGHGTGTVLGDPIEAEALLATYGRDRDADQPLWLGSLKSNIGHTQAAAGVAGVIKMVQALRYGVLPATLNVDEPTSRVDWSSGAVALLTESRPWPHRGRPRRAGISSFGLSGTNAHVILEEAPRQPAVRQPAPQAPRIVPLVLSARGAQALNRLADRLVSLIQTADESSWVNVAVALASRRTTMDERAVVLAGSRDEALAGLRALARDEASPLVVRDSATSDASSGVVLIFPGQGAQWAGMGRELLDTSPAFAEVVQECARLLTEWADWPLIDVLRGEADQELLERVDVIQVASFAMMAGLAALWASAGVRPDAVVGHSQGEIAAAYVAGALSLPDAMRVVVVRSQMIAETLSGRGGMASVRLDASDATARLAKWDGRVQVAAVNGPSSVVLSGDPQALTEALRELAEAGVDVRRVAVDYASHSDQVEAVRERLAVALAGLSPAEPTVPFHSTVTGGRADGALDGDYWYRNLRHQVRFGPTIDRLLEQGFGAFVEVSPHPVLVQPVAEAVHEAGSKAVVAGSLRRDDGGIGRLVRSMAELFARGVPVDWRGLLPAAGRAAWIDLPTYPFERRRFWRRPVAAAGASDLGLADAGHPLLGALVRLPDSGGLIATGRWSASLLPWSGGDESAVEVPEAALVELALWAGDLAGTPVVEELTIDRAVVLPRNGSLDVRILVGQPDAAHRRSLRVYSGPSGAGAAEEWTPHATGTVAPATRSAAEVAGVPAAGAAGATAEVALDDAERPDAQRYDIHPALLDAAVRTVLSPDQRPKTWRGVRLLASGADTVGVRSTSAGDGPAFRVELADPAGQPVLAVAELVAGQRASTADLFRLDWVDHPIPRDTSVPGLAAHYVTDAAGIADAPAALLIHEADVSDGDPRAAVVEVLELIQAFLARPGEDDARLVIVTQDDDGIATSAVRGLVRSAQSEHPGRLVLVAADQAARATASVIAAVRSGEPQLRLRDNRVLVPRLARLRPVAPSPASRPLDPGGTVLITGGTGTLAAVTARHLVAEHGVRRLILAGRRGPEADSAAALHDELAGLGATVRLVAADVADREQVAALLATVGAEHPLTAVVHTAGVLDDAVITELDPHRVDAVFGAKVDAARHLDDLTRDLDLAAFVLYSSAAGVLGNPGQGNYAAANAALDAVARERRQAGLAAVSIAWGYWDRASGLTRHLSHADHRRNRDVGMIGLSDGDGMALFDQALRAGDDAGAAVVAAGFDPVALQAADGSRVPSVLRGLVPAGQPVTPAGATVRPAPAAPASSSGRIGALPPAEQIDALVDLIRRQCSLVLGHASTDAIRLDRTFKDSGFDSLTALELRNRLAAATGLTLSPAMIFDYPRPRSLAAHLQAKLLDDAQAQTRPATAQPRATAEEPIAIVAMACRFPGGVRSPEDLWRILASETDAVTKFPTDRGWDTDRLFDPDPDHPGTTYVRHGAFLDDPGAFDAAFFGISPQEALAMDPQQRLVMETSWELLERAGIDPHGLAAQDVGVFVGVNSHDWTVLTHHASGVEGFRLTGGSGSVVSGRVAYHLGLEGPAITVDTACSSSLVTLHLAVQAIRNGECSMALAGGVMVMGTVETFVEFSRQRGLAPDGRCKAFADAADGTGWSEGVGLLLVEPLSQARARGHRVLALVRGTAVNSDGASNGLTAPNGPSQQRVIRKALAAAGLRGDEVDAVEGHGTGTTLGDPIEAQALLETYGRDRPADRPLWLGSVKSNIGHTQAAAGVAGVIKMVLAMRHGVLPRTLHVDLPSTHVDWSAGAVRLLTERRDWPLAGRPRRAGVSSFGIGGTNAHVILEEAGEETARHDADEMTEDPAPDRPSDDLCVPVPVSGRTPAALRAQAGRLADFVASRPELEPADIALALATGRAQLDRRAVLVVRHRDELVGDLRGLAEGSAPAIGGSPVDGKLAVLFTGQGSQWPGMGRDLAAAFPVFAEAFAAACRAVEKHWAGHATVPLSDVVFAAPGAEDGRLIDQTIYTQAGLFALETALYRLYESWSLRPDLVAGHSIGEITAAHVSGVLDLADAGKLVAARARLMQELPTGGAMVAVQASEAEVTPSLVEAPGVVGVAAVNSARSLVLSGDEVAVLWVASDLAQLGHKTRRLPVSHAFHSPLMRPMLAGFREVAESLTYRPSRVPVVSTVTGRPDAGQQFATADYWVEQVRATVRFGDAVTSLRDQGVTTFLELGPGGVLTTMASESLDSSKVSCVATLRSDGAEVADAVAALGELHVRGVALDWPAVVGRRAGSASALATELPTYAFQSRRYWLDQAPLGDAVPAVTAGPAGGQEDAQKSVAARLADRSRDERERITLEVVRESVAVVVGYQRADLDAMDDDQSFKSLGFDSLGGVRLRNRLRDLTGVDLPVTAVFDHPTPRVLAAHLAGEMSGEVAEVTDRAPAPVADPDEPIAIIGMAVRLPGGVESPDDLWRLVIERRDAVSGFPADRGWDTDGLYHPDPAHPGTTYTRSGGFLYDAAQFDPGLFGISPREALAMDPQQRLLLEASWEAMERAGIDPLSARGEEVGVFTGIVHHDYATRLNRIPEEVRGYVMTGTSPSVASGRIAYVFGFEGPAVTLDTACSSSLVAIHQAAQALRLGECTMALAGGATVMASPEAFVEFSSQRGLSADGRCKAFSSSADGTGWSEGAGVVLLERLSVARQRGHRVLATVRGSAVNSDGVSNGLTAPNGVAQQRVIRRALASAGLGPADVDAVEAHGTGTVLGDPIEAGALLATYGKARDAQQPLWLGSLKSNIGHTQAAAGVAGVIKMVEALRHGVLPPTINVEEPTGQVDWSAGTLALLTEPREWPQTGRPRRVGVSAFGASGTNAHLILEQAPSEEAATAPSEDSDPLKGLATNVVPLVVSAKSVRSLAAQATRLRTSLDSPAQTGEPALPAMAEALVHGRATLPERAVVLAGSRDEALTGLAALARGEVAPNLTTGSVVGSGAPGRLVLVFPGQGSQWAGMGRALLDSSAVFRARIDECARALEPWVDWSLTDVLRGEVDEQTLDRVDVLQPASFAMMVGLAALWESVGVRPDAVVGHSQGEIAAACVAGALSLADAARVVAVRSRAIATTLSGRGGMASVMLGAGEANDRLAAWPGRLEVAVVNGPSSVVIAGDEESLAEALESLTREGVRTRRVPVDYASHTRHVERIEDVLATALSGIDTQPPHIPFYSTVTGGWIDGGDLLGADYWYQNLRQPVGFGPAVASLLTQSFGVFLEVSAHPVLVQPMTDVIDDLDSGARPRGAGRPIVAGTLRRDADGSATFLAAAARLFVGGVPIDWSSALPAHRPRHTAELPTYAFDRQHFWLTEAAPDDDGPGGQATDAGFWNAIEDADPAALATMLELSADQSEALDAVLPAIAGWRRARETWSVSAKLRYAIGWVPPQREALGVPAGRWLVITPESADVSREGLLDQLRANGLDVVPCAVEPGLSTDELTRRLGGVLADDEVTGILSLLALPDRTGRARPDPVALTTATLTLIQALAAAGATAPLWCLTQGAVSVDARDAVAGAAQVAQAAVWGLGRAAALERLDRWGGLVDLPAEPDGRVVRHLLGVLSGASGEDQVAIRRSGVHVRRLRRATGPAGTGSERRWRPRGTVLVTGGAEGLGRYVSLWLAQAGAERLVVTTSEGEPGESVESLRDELAKLASGTVVESCADADRDALAGLVHAPGRPVTAVVHAADLSLTSPIDETSDVEVTEVFRAKVDTAVRLSELTAELPLDAFVVFSSIAGIWGGGGQAAAGAANAVLDALVRRLRADGVPAQAIAWGALTAAGAGMDEETLAQLRRRGVIPMTPETAVAALDQAIQAATESVVVADMDWRAFIVPFTSARTSPLFDDLPEAAAAIEAAQPSDDSTESASSLTTSLRAAGEAEQDRILLRLVRSQASTVLGHSGADGVGPAQAFQEAGFDSLAAVNFRNSLITATGLRLPATLIFDYPTPQAVVEYLRSELLGAEDDVDTREEDVRRILASVPFERFKEAGVLEALLGLADAEAGGAVASDEGPESAQAADDELIDAMDVDSLIERALGSGS